VFPEKLAEKVSGRIMDPDQDQNSEEDARTSRRGLPDREEEAEGGPEEERAEQGECGTMEGSFPFPGHFQDQEEWEEEREEKEGPRAVPKGIRDRGGERHDP
jgi:hypothetical protein